VLFDGGDAAQAIDGQRAPSSGGWSLTSGLRRLSDAAGSRAFLSSALAATLLSLVRVLSGNGDAGAQAASVSQAPSSKTKAPRTEPSSWQAYLTAADRAAGVLRVLGSAWPTGPRFSMEYAPVPPPP
jgi:hypothetical protein